MHSSWSFQQKKLRLNQMSDVRAVLISHDSPLASCNFMTTYWSTIAGGMGNVCRRSDTPRGPLVSLHTHYLHPSRAKKCASGLGYPILIWQWEGPKEATNFPKKYKKILPNSYIWISLFFCDALIMIFPTKKTPLESDVGRESCAHFTWQSSSFL